MADEKLQLFQALDDVIHLLEEKAGIIDNNSVQLAHVPVGIKLSAFRIKFEPLYVKLEKDQLLPLCLMDHVLQS